METQNKVAYNTRNARKRRAKSPEAATEADLEEVKVVEHKRKFTKKTKIVKEEVLTATEEEKVVETTVIVKKKSMETETVEKLISIESKGGEDKPAKRGRGRPKKAENSKQDDVVKDDNEEKSTKKEKSKSNAMEVEDEEKTGKAESKQEDDQAKKKRGGSKKSDKEQDVTGTETGGEEEPSKKGSKKSKEKKEKTPKKRTKSEKKGKKDDDEEDEVDKDKEEKDSKKKKRSKSGKKKSKKGDESESESEDKDEEKKGKKGWRKRSKSKGKKDDDDEKGKEKKKRTGRKMNRNRAELVGLLEKYTPIEQTIELGDGKIAAEQIVISSWNVNGLYTILKGPHLNNYMKDRKPDILCLNETKLSEINIKGVGDSWIPEGYSGYFNCCKIRKWYSGTAIISKHKPISVKFDIGIEKHGLEGRTITLEFENFYLVSCYVPNSGGHLVGVDYRVQEWDPDLRNYLNDLKSKKHVIICGDLNVVHQAIDIFNINNKEGWPGVSPGERKAFDELLGSGFVDTFRHLYPEEKQFSFYCKKLNHRPKNLGWRLDYFLIDKEGLVGVKDSLINNKIYGSDHVPIELVLNPEFK